MTLDELASLTHENLLDEVRHVVQVPAVSRYLSKRDVPAIRIAAYPKRRKGAALVALPPLPAAASAMTHAGLDMTYADFFRDDDRIAI